MANAFHYSIGRKFIQAVSGAFLIIFLLLHVTINLFSVIDSFTGNYNGLDGLFQKGCDFMALPIVTIMVPVLAAGFIIHIIYGCWLTWKNIKARGGYKRYEASSVAAADSWSAKNMFVLGIIILGILAFHLTHFWAKMQLAMFTRRGGQPLRTSQSHFRTMVGAGIVPCLVRGCMVPPLPRFLEHVPDSWLEQPDLVQETESDRHRGRHADLPWLCGCWHQRIPSGKRFDLVKD